MIFFNKNDVSNKKNISDQAFDLVGFNEVINTDIPYKLIDDIFYLLICSILTWLFYKGYKIIQSSEIDDLTIAIWSVFFAVLMSLSIPSNSSDVFGYISRGAQQTLFNQNPYFSNIGSIRNYESNSLFCNFMWPHTPVSYGPLFVYLTKLLLSLSDNKLFLAFFNFKFLNLFFFLFTLSFLIGMNNKKNLYFLSWNPLLLIHGLWNGHNDLICGFFLFLGFYYLSRQNYFYSLFNLMISAGIKYISVLILPIVFYHLFLTKEAGKLKHAILGFLTGMTFVLLFSIDYFNFNSPIEIKQISANVGLVHQSLLATVVTISKYLCEFSSIDFHIESYTSSLKMLFYSTFALIYLYLIFKYKKKEKVFYLSLLILTIFFVFIIPKFHSWYLISLVCLLPFIEDGVLKNFILILSISHSYSITFLDQAKILNFVSMSLIPLLLVILIHKKKMKPFQ